MCILFRCLRHSLAIDRPRGPKPAVAGVRFLIEFRFVPDGQSALLRGNGDVWPVKGSTHRHHLGGRSATALGRLSSVPHNHLDDLPEYDELGVGRDVAVVLLATVPRSDSRTSDHALGYLDHASVLNPVH